MVNSRDDISALIRKGRGVVQNGQEYFRSDLFFISPIGRAAYEGRSQECTRTGSKSEGDEPD